MNNSFKPQKVWRQYPVFTFKLTLHLPVVRLWFLIGLSRFCLSGCWAFSSSRSVLQVFFSHFIKILSQHNKFIRITRNKKYLKLVKKLLGNNENPAHYERLNNKLKVHFKKKLSEYV